MRCKGMLSSLRASGYGVYPHFTCATQLFHLTICSICRQAFLCWGLMRLKSNLSALYSSVIIFDDLLQGYSFSHMFNETFNFLASFAPWAGGQKLENINFILPRPNTYHILKCHNILKPDLGFLSTCGCKYQGLDILHIMKFRDAPFPQPNEEFGDGGSKIGRPNGTVLFVWHK